MFTVKAKVKKALKVSFSITVTQVLPGYIHGVCKGKSAHTEWG